ALDSGDDVAVYTYGWDTAFAIPVPDVNRAIVDHESSPAGFSIQESTYTVKADFGDWQITQGGDGKNVRMLLPLKHVVLHYTTTGQEYSFDSGQAVAEVELHYIPHTGDGDGDPRALVVKTTTDQVDTPVFSVIQMTLSPTPGTVTGALIQQALDDWGNANLDEFSHVFSVVDLNLMVDQGAWGFVTPSYTSYAYLDGAGLDDSVFSVLCMTGQRSGAALSEQVSPHAIPAGSPAGFVVSQARTLYDLVRPAIMQAYPGLTDQNFLMNEDATELYLTDHASVSLPPVTQNGSTYYPRLTQLTVKANGALLTLTSYTETDIVTGITATCTSTHWYTLALGTSSAGQTIVFQEAQTPDIVHDIHQSPGSQLTQLIIEIVAGIAILLLVVLTDGAALVVGGLVAGLLLGADQIVPAAIEKVNHDDSPDVSLLLVNAVHPIRWSDSTDFSLNTAALNVSLQLGGNPNFV
ncbi:MAG TPA: TULIP family P47-like protein, partial [Longimicrobium sp.]|nr:TULIP family P47-like protein [Longimicrobium sp.]